MFKKKNLTKDDDVAHAVNAALRILTRREYSKKELFEKLYLKYTKEASLQALKTCIENNWQSEDRYTEMLFKHIVNMCYGPRKFIQEAAKKGVASSYYSELISQTNWVDVATCYLDKKLSTKELTYEEKQKVLASLARRGFSNSDCISALNQYLAEDFLN